MKTIRLIIIIQLCFFTNSLLGQTFVSNEITYKILNEKSVQVGGGSESAVDISTSSIMLPSTVEYLGKEYSVTSIGANAFKNCINLLSVVIPKGVTAIGDYAFYGCKSLSSIVIPNSVNSIGDYAFGGCQGLSSMTIPESVTRIGVYAFSGCTNMMSIVLPNGIAYIGNYTFSGCTGLSSIVIPENVTSIGSYAFNNCVGLSSIVIPKNVSNIGSYAFYACKSLSSVTIGGYVKSVGQYAFNECSSLYSFISYDGVHSIEKYAFSGCSSLTSVIIHGAVTIIGIEAFANCENLFEVVIPEGVKEIESNAFWGCSSLSSVIIPKGLTTIGSRAFSGCSSLVSIVIPASVTYIDQYAIYNQALKEVHVFVRNPSNIRIWREVFNPSSGSTLFVPYGSSKQYMDNEYWAVFETIKEMPPMLGDYFTATLVNDSIDLEVEIVEKSPFRVKLLSTSFRGGITTENLVIPKSISGPDGALFDIAEIGSGAFNACSQLKRINIPETIVRIDKAFMLCDSLRNVIVHWRNPSNVSVDSENFDGIPNDAVLYVPAGTSKRYAEMEVWNKFSQIIEFGSTFIGDLYAKSGGRINLPLYLNNEESMAGMQYRLTLPEGVSPVLEEGEYLTSLTDRTKTMTIVGRKDPDNDNSYLFAMLSLEGDTVVGNKGVLVNLKVEVDENVGLGEYKVELDDVLLVTSSIETITSPKTSSFFIIKDIVMGDINEDGYIDVADLAAQVRLILGTDNINWIAYAGDMDESGEIEVNDYVALVNTALRQYQTSYMARERTLGLEEDVPSILHLSSLVIDDGEEGDLCLSLSKDSIPYTALQFDLALPAGVSIVDEGTEAASRKHNVWYEMNTDGTYRVMCASMSNAVFADGDILRLRVKADGAKQGIHEARIDNVVLSDIEAVRYTTGAAKTNIQVGKDTGVSELYKQGLLVSVKNAHLVLTAYSAQHVQIVLPNGMEVESLTMEEGEVVYRALPKGVYIVNGKKINL